MASTQTTKGNGKNGKNGKGKHAAPTDAPPPIVPKVSGRQQEIPGTSKDVKPPKAVEQAAEKLRSKFNAEKRAKKDTASARGHLEMLMVEHNIPRLEIEDDEGDRVEIYVDITRKIRMRVIDEEN